MGHLAGVHAKATPSLELVSPSRPRAHEEVDSGHVEFLERAIESDRVLREPIWVGHSQGLVVILNGHHRYHALLRLGAQRIPAWTFDYDDPIVQLGRWGEGPLVTKAEVVRRAREGTLFPPKTTRHTVLVELPRQPTPLASLVAPARAPSTPLRAPGTRLAWAQWFPPGGRQLPSRGENSRAAPFGGSPIPSGRYE